MYFVFLHALYLKYERIYLNILNRGLIQKTAQFEYSSVCTFQGHYFFVFLLVNLQ
jgi:hypothetical protein